MKKLIVLLILALPVLGYCQTGSALPYSASYSSKFKISESNKYIGIVLSAWKAFENDKLEANSPWIADTVNAEMADGTKLKGKADFYNAIKQYRSSITDLKVDMPAFMGVKSIDKNEEIVLLWASETYTQNGQKTTEDLHQVWIFNKAGQVAFFKDFSGNNMKPMAK